MEQEDPTKRILYDYYHQEIKVGDFVIAAQGHVLETFKVTRITPKMVRIVKVQAANRFSKKGKLRYPNELFKVPAEMVTYYLLSNAAIDKK